MMKKIAGGFSFRKENAPAVRQSRTPAESMRFPAAAVGWLLRVVLAGFGAYAFAIFLGDAFSLFQPEGPFRADAVYVSEKTILGCCAAAALIGGFLFTSFRTAIPTLILLGGLGSIWIVPRAAELFRFAENAARCLVNQVLLNMAYDGYTVMMGYMLDSNYRYEPEVLLTWGFCAVAVVLLMIFCILLVSRVRPVLLTLLCAGIMVPIFLYNITNTNQGVLLVIAFVAGAVALWLYDRGFGLTSVRIRRKKEVRLARKEAKKKAKTEQRTRRKALKLAASDAMIAAREAGGTRRDAKLARAAVYRQEKLRRLHAKKTAAAERIQAKQQRKKQRVQTEKTAANRKIMRAQRRTERKEKRTAAREKRRNRFYSSAAGGYMGAGAVIVALAAMLIPNALVSDRFPVIESLDNKIRTARIYTTAYLMGDDIDLNSLSLYGGVSELNPRTLSFESPTFTGAKVFTVECGYNAPVYLRSWIAGTYDLESDTWISADNEEVMLYRSQFSSAFSSDIIGYNFRKYTAPSSVQLDRAGLFRDYSSIGYFVAQCDIQRVGGSSRILFVPMYLNTGMGILEYGSIEQNQYKVSSYYDGVYSSRFFAAPGRTYSTYSFITTMKNPALARTLEIQAEYFRQSQLYAEEVLRLEKEARQAGGDGLDPETAAKVDQLLRNYEWEMGTLGASSQGDESILRRYISMTSSERNAFHASGSVEESYRSYAYEKYSAPFGSEKISALADELLLKAGWHVDESAMRAAGEDPSLLRGTQSGQRGDLADFLVDENGERVPRHTLVLMVLQYLRGEEFRYSLTPAAPENPYSSTLEAFLFETKEGYCVHFATAAAAILREYGLAVRYNEGYSAASFWEVRVPGMASVDYKTDVFDYNAHAWVEVYFPQMGWMQYEATPSYMAAMYDPDENYKVVDHAPFVEDEVPEEEEIELTPVPKTDYTKWIIASVAAGVLLLCALIIVLLFARGKRWYLRRCSWIDAAKDEEAYRSGIRDNREAARVLNDAILRIYAELGCPPEAGELSTEYAERIKAEYGELSRTEPKEILDLIAKAEFGPGLSYPELCTLAEYLDEFSTAVYRGLRAPRRFWMRCIRCVV